MKNQRIQNLIRQVKKGNKKAFAEIYDEYKNVIKYNILKRFSGYRDEQIVDDIVHESLIKAYENIDKYQPTFSFSSWLNRIAFNHMLDLNRKISRHDVFSIDQGSFCGNDYEEDSRQQFNIQDPNPIAYNVMMENERNEKIRSIINSSLKEEYVEIVNQRYFQEKKYKEISKDLNMNLNTVKSKLKRIHNKLKTDLNEFSLNS